MKRFIWTAAFILGLPVVYATAMTLSYYDAGADFVTGDGEHVKMSAAAFFAYYAGQASVDAFILGLIASAIDYRLRVSTRIAEALQQRPLAKRLTALAVIAALFGVAIAMVVSKNAVNYFTNRHRPPQLENWPKQTFHGLSLDSPVSSFHTEDLRNKIPAGFEEMIQAVDSCSGTDKSKFFTVGLTRFIDSPKFTYDLDTSVQSAVAFAAKRLGEKDPKYSSTRVIISRLEGRRVIYRPAIGGQLEWVVVGRKNKLWIVIVTAYTNASAQDAQRVLNSIAINPDE